MTYDEFPNQSQKTRKIRIWTPSSYDENNKELNYPVIYMHDAQNLFNVHTSFAGEWEIDESIEDLMDEFDFDGVIVVGIDNSAERMGELVYDYPFLEGAMGATKTGNYYMDFIVDVVKPYIDENYNTLTNRSNTYISGSSLGGLISLFGGLAELETFGGILAFSSSTQLVDEESLDDYFSSLDIDLLKKTKFFFYVGTSGDGNVNWPNNYKNKLLALDINENNIEVLTGQGYGHNEPAWKKHFPMAIKWLFDLDTEK